MVELIVFEWELRMTWYGDTGVCVIVLGLETIWARVFFG